MKRSADEAKRGKKKTKWCDSSRPEWIDQNRNNDFLAEWIDCGTGSYLHNLMA